MLRHLLTLCLLLSPALSGPALAETLYYNIAHAINNTRHITWAVDNGANAIEADLNFHPDGRLQNFQHRPTCECAYTFLNLSTGDLCQQIKKVDKTYQFDYRDPTSWKTITSGEDACNMAEDPVSFLHRLALHPEIALFIVDSKISRSPKSTEVPAGQQVIAALNQELFARGYQGKVIVGAAKMESVEYIRSAAQAARSSPYANRIYFSFDENGQDAANQIRAVDLLASFTSQGAVGNGITAVLPLTYHAAFEASVREERLGRTHLNYVWTIDKATSMRDYLNIGVRGIMTNNPSTLRDTLRPYLQDGGRMARPGDPIL